MPAPNAITPANLQRLIGTPNAPRLIDVTTNQDFSKDPTLIHTAERVDFSDTARLKAIALATQAKCLSLVIICQKGEKLSQGIAALLRAEGIYAQYLDGGNHAWREEELPRVPARHLPSRGSAWVTRQRPKIDRIACPWLITRFIDPDARFLFVEPSAVLEVASKLPALAYDTEDAPFSHGRQGCTFSSLLEHFALDTPALARMDTVISAADLGQLDAAPEAAGLLALSIGFSRQFKDDNVQLTAALPLYDALFHWARDGYEETHMSQFGQNE